MKVLGALMSMEAKGTLGGVLTFSKRASGQICRYQKKQTDANSVPQQEQRADFLIASVACRNMEYGDRQYGANIYGANAGDYELSAMDKMMSGYNICIQETLLALA